ncbi:androgen-induced protein [Anaeramoeba flamelloides]|uniref:Androgen-induced protein n=1 Tax=Anaeramoeba flamelloides TaxID=1746091 RepID=A0ABQ8Z120_9EUKA|nr:androgen-induced protein [Anaeramoeba flamelloides]
MNRLIISTTWSIIVNAVCWYSWYNLYVYNLLNFKYQAQFFTKWSFVIEHIFYIAQSIVQIYHLVFKRKEKIKSSSFYCLLYLVGASTTAIASGIFWGLVLMEPKLIFSNKVRKQPPMFVHHLFHTATLVYSVVELLIAPRLLWKIPGDLSMLFSCLFISCSYGVYNRWKHVTTGKAVYPFIDKFSPTLWVIFFVGTGVLGYIISKFLIVCMRFTKPKEKNEGNEKKDQRMIVNKITKKTN